MAFLVRLILMPGTINSMTVSQEGRYWNVAIQVELEIKDPMHPNLSRVGIDMGIVNFAVLSNRDVIAPLNSFRRHERELAMAQHSLSRKTKFGKNWNKQKAVVSVLHRKIDPVQT